MTSTIGIIVLSILAVQGIKKKNTAYKMEYKKINWKKEKVFDLEIFLDKVKLRRFSRRNIFYKSKL